MSKWLEFDSFKLIQASILTSADFNSLTGIHLFLIAMLSLFYAKMSPVGFSKNRPLKNESTAYKMF